MKNKIQKIIAAFMITIVIGINNSYADRQMDEYLDDEPMSTGAYAATGALLGLVGGATTGYFIGKATASSCYEDSFEGTCGLHTVYGPMFGAGIGLVAGSLIGLAIGSAKNKKDDFAIAPTFDTTPGAMGGGVNFSMKF